MADSSLLDKHNSGQTRNCSAFDDFPTGLALTRWFDLTSPEPHTQFIVPKEIQVILVVSTNFLIYF